MADEKKVQEFFQPPPQLSKWDGFMLFLWNDERKEFMGRTGCSWAKIGLFYLVFYSALAAFFAVMLVIFYQTLDNFEPKWKRDSSIIGDNPGLGFRPMPDRANIESTLIWFRHGANQSGNWLPWYNRMNDFLDAYEEGRQFGQTAADCSISRPPPGKACSFTLNNLGVECTRQREFGYSEGRPCILIKLNRIFGWEPIPYNSTNLHKAKDMPSELVEEITLHDGEPLVWLTCEGENPADRENIGPLSYSPSQGFPTKYFPFTNTPGYLSPFVMVQFLKPFTGVLINIECKAWAENIEHNRMERKGSVHFELLMD